MLPDLVSRESERRAMRDEKIADREEEIKSLRARCARLRAALAGVVFFTGDVDDAASLEAELKARSGAWFFTPAEKIALEVLRETAGEGKDA